MITILTVALSASFLLQQLDSYSRTVLANYLVLPLAGLIAILAVLCVPRFNRLIIMPYKIKHIPIQLGVCLTGAVLIIWAGGIAFHAPLALWLAPVYTAPQLALGCGALFVCLGVLGSLRAVWPTVDENTPDTIGVLRKVHYVARALSAVFAFAFSGIILGSIMILNNPTTTTTVFCSIVMMCFAGVFGASGLSVSNFKNPLKLWNIALQFSVAFAAILIIKISTRAFLFHTHLFESFSAIVPVYPRFENLLMLPFIVFGLTSIALALERQKKFVDFREVFA